MDEGEVQGAPGAGAPAGAPAAGSGGGGVKPPAVEKIKLAPHPGIGKGGTRQMVQVNMFGMTANLPPVVRHYDVDLSKIHPHDPADEKAAKVAELVAARELGEKTSREAISVLERRLKKLMAYDGRKNVYAIDLGITQAQTFELDVYSDKIQCVIKDVGSVDTREMTKYFRQHIDEVPTAVLSFLEIVLHTKPAKTFVHIGNNFYSEDRKLQLGGGAEGWRGFYHAIKPLARGMTLALDAKVTGFWSAIPLLELAVQVPGVMRHGDQTMTDRARAILSQLIKGVRVTQTNRAERAGGTGRKVVAISSYAAADLVFEESGGQSVSVADYFARAYKQLEFPGLPCVQVGSRKRPMYLPLEVVKISPNQRRHHLDDHQVGRIKDVACTRPNVRFDNVDRMRKLASYESDEYLKEFGLSVDDKVLQVPARTLNPPTLIFNHAQQTIPREGRWNMREKVYYQPGKILHYWGVLILEDAHGRAPRGGAQGKLGSFINQLVTLSNKTGLAISNTRPLVVVKSKSDVAEGMREIKRIVDGDAHSHGQPGCQLILVVKPANETSDYREIKFQSDSVLGCPSQCMLAKHLEKANLMYVANLGLKINCKLGGGNVTLTQPSLDRLKARKTLMIMGLDLSLESKSIARTTDAVAALVGTLNHQFTQYASAYRFQPSSDEYVRDLQQLAEEVFRSYFNRWQKLPDALLVYRDGVADSQFKNVLNLEVTLLHAAYQKVLPGPSPEVTFVVLQKRHRTRFMPVEQRHTDSKGNCKPGLCVDESITQPHQFEFYLQSHTALQGTVRPVRVVTLIDELGLSADELQEITHALCYVNARCTLSTSVVAPIAYSALVAERGRVMRAGGLGEVSDDGASSVAGGAAPSVASVNNDIKLSDQLKDTLYYM